MVALAGTVKGNTVVIENDNLEKYDGKQIIITILDESVTKKEKQ